MVAKARHGARRLLRGAVRRLPPVVQRGVREGWRRVRPYAKSAYYSRVASPLVSIVIPVYDVERYLPECLDSVLSQSYRNLQVILVDDGSTDASIDIIRGYARADRRITVIRTANVGLGSARNTGALHATGRFLMFVDSDDVLRPDAILSYVRIIRRSGSDFVVGGYDRMNSSRSWPAAPWIRSAHRFSRLRTTVAASPDVLVNAVAWSKFYRRTFWDANGFAFPEGVLYEDQALSARAYARASSFDILAKVTYGWRVREDRTSITQQATTPADLRARLRAAENSLAELDQPGLRHAYATRLAQYLSNDFPLSIRAAQFAGDEFWDLLTAGLRRLTSRASDEVWATVPAQHRIAIRLVTEGHRAAVIDFVGLGHNDPRNIPVLVAAGHVYLDPPARRVLGLERADPLLALTDRQLKLVSSVQRARWDGDHRYHLEGWAYIDNLDLGQVSQDPDNPAGPGGWRTKITAVEQRTGLAVPLAVELRPSVEVTAVSLHRYADYEPSCFRAVLDVPAALAALAARSGNTDPDRSDWQLHVAVGAAGIRRSGVLAGLDQDGSPGRLLADFLPDGRLVEVGHSGRTGVRLAVRRPRCVVAGVRLDGRELRLAVTGGAGFSPHALELTGDHSKQVLRVPLSRDTVPEVCLRLPGSQPRTGAPPASETWTVRVLGADGTRRPAAWPDAPPGQESDLTGPRLERTQDGNLGIVDEPTAVRIDAATVTEGGLLVSGAAVAGSDPDAEPVLRLDSPTAYTEAVAYWTAPGRFAALLPLQSDPWGLGALPLPVGDYRLTAALGAAEHIPVHATDTLIGRLPITFRTDRLLGRIRLDRPNQPALRLEIPLADDERGARQQQRLQDALRARLADPAHDPGAILLRSYSGESCGCNPAALQRYLRDHEVPGGPYTSCFAIKDHSVRVPDGAVGVLHESAEWYRLLHDARVYVDNGYQPCYHTKPAHQLQIRTFHEYPFGPLGLSHWKLLGYEPAHVQSLLNRAADWDYLVSPASYAAQALAREFGFPNTVLQIGCPRNDVLFSPAADKTTAAVRDRLGIRPDQTAVLCEPTVPDPMSADTAEPLDFLDVDQLAEALGDDFVILVRGTAGPRPRTGDRPTIIDISEYPDVTDLCLACDAAVLGYSSLRFDYGLTGKPMIFIAPDPAYRATAPGPLLTSTTELITTLRDLDRVRSEYAGAYATFRRDYLELDDGHATERLVQRVFPA